MSTLNVDKVDPNTGTALEIGSSGDTVTVPTGAGLTVVDEVTTNKVSPATGTAFALGDSGDTFTVPSGATIVNSGTATGFGITQTSFLPTANPLIINGNMAVAQRGTSVAGPTTGTYPCADRIKWHNASDAVVTISQATDVPTGGGFATSFKVDVTTADASVGAAQGIWIQYSLEGQNVQVFKKGTASAEAFTVAFWVKSTKTGTFIVELYDTDNTRTCSQALTVDTTNTWEKKILNFPADTTGAFGNDNGSSLLIYLTLMAGSDYTSGSLQTTWAARDDTKRYVGQVNAMDSTSNDFLFTGLQLEVGTYTSADLPPFRHESYGDNLARCHRYYITYGTVGSIQDGYPGRAYSGTAMVWAVPLPRPLRASPDATLTGTLRAFGYNATFDSTTALAVYSYANTNSNMIALLSTGFSGLANDTMYNILPVNDCFIELDAEFQEK